MTPLRVLLVDDSPRFLQLAARYLAADSRIEIVGSALSGREALEQVTALQPDLVFMDVAMPDMNGLEATRAIKERAGAVRVVIVTLYDNAEYRAAAQRVGADGFLAKSEFVTEVFDVITSLIDPAASPVDGAGGDNALFA